MFFLQMLIVYLFNTMLWTSLILVLISLACNSAGQIPNGEAKFSAVDDVLSYNKRAQDLGGEYGKKWIAMADGNGKPILGLVHLEPSLNYSMFDSVQYYYYSKDHPQGVLLKSRIMDNKVSFNPKVDTKFIVHGWWGSADHESTQLVQQEYVKHTNHNVITFDWRMVANDMVYSRAAHSTSMMGVILGKFIDDYVAAIGTNYSKIHIIGHSLGAHVASAAGKFTKQRLGRITGLDAAAPCFDDLNVCQVYTPLTKLMKTDALFVDVIHTCVGAAGLEEPQGMVDFYPNGGSPLQPGCFFTDSLVSEQACSHARSYKYFAESIGTPTFKSVMCDSWTEFLENGCKKIYQQMGEYAKPDVFGVFYLKTNDMAPYSLGESGIHP